MKRLFLKKILLVSVREQKARKIEFGDGTNVVLGANDMGKSCLLKSIYETFGASPAKIHTSWRKAEVKSVVYFEIDREEYILAKFSNQYAIFNQNKELLENFSSVTNDLGPYLAKLFNFGMVLNNRNNVPVVPPPAYFFLPFYVDQDAGWSKNWNSFSALEQFSNWKKPLIEYHAGIYPNDYYRLKTEIERFKKEIADHERDLETLMKLVRKIDDQHPVMFDLNIDSFKEEVNALLLECQKLKEIEDKLRYKLNDLNNQKMHIENQIALVRAAEQEFHLDYEFATRSITEETVACPTCGASYENSFAERFAIAKDENQCREFLLELTENLEKLRDQIKKENARYHAMHADFTHINDILTTKKSEIELRDVIEAEGKKEFRKDLKIEVNERRKDIAEKKAAIEEFKEGLKQFTDKKRKELINEFYLACMKSYLHKLNVHDIGVDEYEAITATIKETGSDLPRSLVAYVYSVLQTMNRFSSSTFAPIVIDSPNQQGQDPANLRNVIQFILNNKPPEAQLILGLENLSNVTFDGKLIELTVNRSLLLADEYDEVWDEVQMLLRACI